MAKRLSDDELLALTDQEMRQAVGFYGGKLAEQRRKAEAYFYGLAEGDLAPPEVMGRSSVVVPVVRNTIEAMLPQLMVKFTGGDTVVEFEPTLPDDEQKAKNCTDYLNYLFFKKNNGHTITYSWFKDALKLKRGIVKVWWDTRDEETREEYRGLSQVELAQIMDDPEVEVIEQKSYPDEEDAKARQQALEQMQGQLDQAVAAAESGDQQAAQAVGQIQAQMQQVMQTPPAMLYDIACKRKKTGGKLCVENVPPEEFLISRKAKNIQESPFVGHRVRRTLSELRSQGYDAKKLESLSADGNEWANAERAERMQYDDDYIDQEEDSADESQKRVWLTECYMRVDADGDGIAELRKICRAGGEILSNEVVDIIPFVSICPIPEPHKFFGLSIADLTMPGQLAETGLLRAAFDNQFLQTNGRYYAVEGQVNLDDLLTSRPGGVVRIKSAQAVGRLDQGAGDVSGAMGMLEYMKGFNEDSSGWSRQSQGNDPSSLKQNETATKANIVTNRADMRVDLIARNFAEGFVELFRMMLKLVRQYQNKRVQIMLSGKWVDMDPREWSNQFDVSINVGLGVGNKDQQVAHLNNLFAAMGNAMPLGLVKPQNVHAILSELAKAMGFKNPDKFFTEPDPNQPPPDPMQGQMQIEQMKLQMQAQVEQAKKQADIQLERERMQMQAQVDANRQRVEAEQQQAKLQMEMQLEQAKHQMQMELEREKVQLQAQVQMEIARINAAAKIDAAQLQAQTTLSAQQEAASDAAAND